MSIIIDGDSVAGTNNIDTVVKTSVPTTLTGSSTETNHRYILKIPGANAVHATADFGAFWLACYSQTQTLADVAADFAARTGTGVPCTFIRSQSVGTSGGFLEFGPFEDPITEIWVVGGGFSPVEIVVTAMQTSEQE